jgi:hypothetical protein
MDRRMSRRSFVAVAVLVVVVVVSLGFSSAYAKDQAVMKLSAFAVSQEGSGGQATVFQIDINRWSTQQEIDSLKALLVEKGEGPLLAALEKIKPPCGIIATNNSIGWDLHGAIKTPLPNGGQKIVLITNRPMSFARAAGDSNSTNYQFTLAEIRLDKDNGRKGEGKLAQSVGITYNPTTKGLELTNYGALPLGLSDVVVNWPKEEKKK